MFNFQVFNLHINASVFHLTHSTDFIFTQFTSFQSTLSTVVCFYWNILCDNGADLITHKTSTPDLLGGLFRAICSLDASVAVYKECMTRYLMKKTQAHNHHIQHINEFTALSKPYNA